MQWFFFCSVALAAVMTTNKCTSLDGQQLILQHSRLLYKHLQSVKSLLMGIILGHTENITVSIHDIHFNALELHTSCYNPSHIMVLIQCQRSRLILVENSIQNRCHWDIQHSEPVFRGQGHTTVSFVQIGWVLVANHSLRDNSSICTGVFVTCCYNDGYDLDGACFFFRSIAEEKWWKCTLNLDVDSPLSLNDCYRSLGQNLRKKQYKTFKCNDILP